MSDDKLIGSRALRERYNGISDMALWRWLHDDELGFPHPLYIKGRRYWQVSRLEQWERARAAAA